MKAQQQWVAIQPATATATVPGTCGEWVQGTLDDVPCLVSCAIDWYAHITVTVEPTTTTWTLPDGASKMAQALRLALWNRVYSTGLALAARGSPPIGGHVRSDNPLPPGRGYASSTADVAGVIYALGWALGAPFAPWEVASLAVQVEPSDGTMFPELTLFAHRTGAFVRPLGGLPPLSVVVVDPGGFVDTLAFNAADHRAALRRLAPIHRDAFTMLESGLKAGDAALVARAATLSAMAHQEILFSPLVEACLSFLPSTKALGICRAHSGTIVGLICDPAQADFVAKQAAERFAGCAVRVHRCVGGIPLTPPQVCLPAVAPTRKDAIIPS